MIFSVLQHRKALPLDRVTLWSRWRVHVFYILWSLEIQLLLLSHLSSYSLEEKTQNNQFLLSLRVPDAYQPVSPLLLQDTCPASRSPRLWCMPWRFEVLITLQLTVTAHVGLKLTGSTRLKANKKVHLKDRNNSCARQFPTLATRGCRQCHVANWYQKFC